MQTQGHRKDSTTSAHAHSRLTCPECGTAVHRTHRRPLERVVSLIVPLRRYSCHQCGWSAARVDWRAPRLRRPSPQDMVRIVLIICALIAIVGIALNIVQSAMQGM